MEFHKDKLIELLYLKENWERNPQFLPQHFVPEAVDPQSDEYKIFLFTFCFLTPRNNSTRLIEEIRQILKQGSNVRDIFSQILRRRNMPVMRKYKLWFNTSVKSLGAWDNISDFEKWDSVSSFVEARGKKFPGWGPKIYSLYRMTLDEMSGIRAPFDAFPVDVHIIRVLKNFEIFDPGNKQVCIKRVEKFIRLNIADFLQEQNMRPWELHNPMWYLGSQRCSRCAPLFCDLATRSCNHLKNSTKDYWTGILSRKR